MIDTTDKIKTLLSRQQESWTKTFLRDIAKRIEDGKSLTANQTAKLETLWRDAECVPARRRF